MVVNYWMVGASPIAAAHKEDLSNARVPNTLDLYHIYNIGELHEQTELREALQAEEDSGTIVMVGAWDVATGQPMGGVGSPWFVTPPGFDTSDQRVYLAGQVPRIFI